MKHFPAFPLFLVLIIAVLGSCDKKSTEPNPNIDWNGLKTALIESDRPKVGEEISKLLVNTNAKPTKNDATGQRANIDNLVSEFNRSGTLTAELICYACIETLPQQSEIRVTMQSGDESVVRVIDIITPEDGILRFGSVHD